MEAEIAAKVFLFLLFIGLCFWYFSSEKNMSAIIQNKITTMQAQMDNLEGKNNALQRESLETNKRIDEWLENQKKLTISNEDKLMRINEFCKEMNTDLSKFIQKAINDTAFRIEKLHGENSAQIKDVNRKCDLLMPELSDHMNKALALLRADIDLLKGKCDHLAKDTKRHEHNLNWLKSNKEPQIVEVSFIDKPKISTPRKEIKKIKDQIKDLSQ